MLSLLTSVALVFAFLLGSVVVCLLFVVLVLCLGRLILDALRWLREGRALLHEQKALITNSRQVVASWKDRYQDEHLARLRAEADLQRLQAAEWGKVCTAPQTSALVGEVEGGDLGSTQQAV